MKPIDDVFDANDVVYIRYMDDIVILSKTKRQLARCRRQLMNILQERKLTLSRKKTRIGPISTGFHFCGVDYPGTQTHNIVRVESAINDDQIPLMADCNLAISNGWG
ncbi:MAG TPA: reverse transcriptase domain-containing protein [Candidatus Babeliaceae bacterium]|nr:reverse transcriptase domain-containing protein [Candidatus Babeliaceae bacterium]